MTGQDVAAESLAAALRYLDAARPIPADSPVAIGFARRAQAHALTGILAALIEPLNVEPAPSTDIRFPAGATLLSSDCRDDAHRACAGSGWDDAANEVADCPCGCHA